MSKHTRVGSPRESKWSSRRFEESELRVYAVQSERSTQWAIIRPSSIVYGIFHALN